MLTSITADGVDHLRGDKTLGFVPGLNIVCGPVGSGKSMVLRDCLFLLLSGRVPGSRTLSSIGKKFRLSVGLVSQGKTLTIMRTGSDVVVLEDPKANTAAAACGHVAGFTGIGTKELFDMCYVNGVSLPATVLYQSQLLNLVRAAAGLGQLQSFGKLVNQELKGIEGRIQALQLQLASVTQASEPLTDSLNALRSTYSKLQDELEKTKEGEAISRQVMQCRDRSELEAEIGQLVSRLGALADSKGIEEKIGRLAGYKMLHELISADIGDASPDEFKDRLPRTMKAYETAEAFGDSMNRNPGELLAMVSRLKALRSTSSVTVEEKQQATAYIKYVDELKARSAEVRSQIMRAESDLRQALVAENQRETWKANLEALSRAKGECELALEFLQPSGKHSVERSLVEDTLRGVLQLSTEYLNRSGVQGDLLFTAEDGLMLKRSGGICSSKELSGGESTLAALALRLATAATIQPAPFLILDDITGPLGGLVPGTCDMLGEYAYDNQIPIVLPTHDSKARGDHIIRF